MNEKKFHITAVYDEVKWFTGTEYECQLPEDFKKHAQLKRWCEENCEDVVVYLTSSRRQIFFFGEIDATAYRLMWE